MPVDKFRKIVVIKDIPSSYIEEAIFILRCDEDASGKGDSKARIIQNKMNMNSDHLIKEAQNIINNYIIEYEKENTKQNGRSDALFIKEPGESKIKKRWTRKITLNKLIFVASLVSLIAFIYLLIRIVKY